MWQPVEPMKSSYKTRAKREAEKIEIQNQVELKKKAEEARAYKGGKGGGGRKDLAQGGGSDVSQINESLKYVEDKLNSIS